MTTVRTLLAITEVDGQDSITWTYVARDGQALAAVWNRSKTVNAYTNEGPDVWTYMYEPHIKEVRDDVIDYFRNKENP